MKARSETQRLTADEFLLWAREQPGRYELAGGEVVAMTPERAGHTRAKLATVKALEAAIGAAGLPCEAMTDGMSVRIDELTVYEPDALVHCGEPISDDAAETSDPVVVVEVVSPSSRSIDSGAKLTDYFRLSSLRHYIVVNPDARAVTHHCRDDSGDIATRILREGMLELNPPGITVEVAGFFPPKR